MRGSHRTLTSLLHTGGMRVLVVEDNPTLADGLQRGLVAEGFDVDVSHDGADGLWRAREFPYDLVVLDILLPGMNGYEMCRTLRSADVHTPILMLTAKDGEEDEAEGLDLGADDYLSKPFAYAVLVARIRALLRRCGRPSDRRHGDGRRAVDRLRRAPLCGRRARRRPHPERVLPARGVRATSRRPLAPVRAVRPGVGSRTPGAVERRRRVRRLPAPQARPRRPDAGRIETVRGIGYRMVA